MSETNEWKCECGAGMAVTKRRKIVCANGHKLHIAASHISLRKSATFCCAGFLR